MSRLPALTPDDPLQPSPAIAVPQTPDEQAAATPPATDAGPVPDAATEGARAAARIRRPRPTRSVLQTDATQTAPETHDLGWSGASDVVTMRLPTEVLRALDERVRKLAVPKGMTVAAAVLELLKLADDKLIEVVDETQQRYDTARRRARRAA